MSGTMTRADALAIVDELVQTQNIRNHLLTIVACALVHPDRKIAPLTVDFVRKRFKEKSFARGARREEILTCEENLGLTLPEFIAIGLEALAAVGL